MHDQTTCRLKRCRLVSAAILACGLAIASVIYLTAGEEHNNPFAEYEGSKRFAGELERMGGKGAVVANEIGNWFAALWQGRRLAVTVVCISVLVAGGYYIIASGGAGPRQRDDKGDDDGR